MPLAFVHAPWTMSPAEMTAVGCTVGTDYPAPLESLFVWPSEAEKGPGGQKNTKGQRSRRRERGKGQGGRV